LLHEDDASNCDDSANLLAHSYNTPIFDRGVVIWWLCLFLFVRGLHHLSGCTT
jgi:hypothetical protein